ncbi:hypothetical protein G8A07_04165 [Roseateles sp. DAIF2]|uniref:hypothetical protein n=1 Tax=Roseateles sp. DAIF2 TaxID=2714952 RepID=UPI0018A2D47E|nr:hypothetical protein [Roseateles sp. DAIF2]QPF72202.1 hypothetical protein G8A07_04165 [Roseateles sp. DAIF2]
MASPPPPPAILPGAVERLGVQRFDEAAAALERPFAEPLELLLRRDGEARNVIAPPHCRALLDLRQHIVGTRPAIDWGVLQQRLADCRALQWLTRAAPPLHSALPVDLAAARDTRLWPAQALRPAVSPDEMAAIQARPAASLHEFSGRRQWRFVASAGQQGQVLQLRGPAYELQLQWLARADFDGDGWEDWLLNWRARAVDGSWQSSRNLLLTRKPSRAGSFSVRVSE